MSGSWRGIVNRKLEGAVFMPVFVTVMPVISIVAHMFMLMHVGMLMFMPMLMLMLVIMPIMVVVGIFVRMLGSYKIIV